jgi:trehalose 6-phosphate synthase
MNLVAKEYVAAQDPDDPGVLILSRFAGAAIDLRRALLVNPYDAESVANAIAQALAMPLEERRDRHRALLAMVSDHDVDRWQREFLSALRGDNGNTRELHSTPTLPPWPSQSQTPELSEFAPAGQSGAC